MFFRGSRYEPIPEAQWRAPDGRLLRYKRRRVIRDVKAPLATVVRSGDRPDLIAHRTLGDPELFWMLCDANRQPHPAQLTATPGATIAVPGPEPGAP